MFMYTNVCTVVSDPRPLAQKISIRTTAHCVNQKVVAFSVFLVIFLSDVPFLYGGSMYVYGNTPHTRIIANV
jgi:hypothetical protein